MKLVSTKPGSRMRAMLLMLVMLVCMVGSSTAAFADSTSGSVNDLWGQVSATGVGEDLSAATTDLGTVVSKGQELARAITGILTILAFVSLLIWVAKLAMSAGNPQGRKVALTGILFSGIAIALLGGSWVVVSFFWNLFAGV